MKIVSHGMAITLAALTLAGNALAAPVETILYSFKGGSDGVGSFAGLITDKEGALYGTTSGGGAASNGNCANPLPCGTVFKLTPPAKGQTGWRQQRLPPPCWPDRRQAGCTLRHNRWQRDWQCGHSLQADAAPQGSERLDRDCALQLLLAAKL
jgi:hypothetical protein